MHVGNAPQRSVGYFSAFGRERELQATFVGIVGFSFQKAFAGKCANDGRRGHSIYIAKVCKPSLGYFFVPKLKAPYIGQNHGVGTGKAQIC